MEKKILLVDRAFMMRKMMTGVLEKAGYKVVGECDSIAKTLELTAELSPDVVMTEVLLKETEIDTSVTGITMTEDLLRQYPGVTVVVCTKMNMYPPLPEEARKAGVKAILQKADFNPSNPEKGLAELEKVLKA